MTTKIEILGKTLIEWAAALTDDNDDIVTYLRHHLKDTYILDAWLCEAEQPSNPDLVLVEFWVLERPTDICHGGRKQPILLYVTRAEWDRAAAESPFITPLAEIENDAHFAQRDSDG